MTIMQNDGVVGSYVNDIIVYCSKQHATYISSSMEFFFVLNHNINNQAKKILCVYYYYTQ